MPQAPSTVDRIESAANITLTVSVGGKKGADEKDAQFMEIPISRLDATKDIEISEIRESSLKATGFSITSISYSGTMMFKGNQKTKQLPDSDKSVKLNDLLYDKFGVPEPVSVTVNHELNSESDTYQDVMVTSDSYEVRSEEATETAYDWVAMDRSSDNPQESENAA
jgi:hypothetical protein